MNKLTYEQNQTCRIKRQHKLKRQTLSSLPDFEQRLTKLLKATEAKNAIMPIHSVTEIMNSRGMGKKSKTISL